MGVSTHCVVFVGFKVSREDFEAYTTDGVATCEQGHVQAEGAPPYCGQDGTKFERRKRLVLAPTMLALAKDLLDMEPEDDGEPEVFMDEFWEALYFKELCVNDHIGVRLLEAFSSDYRRASPACDPKAVQVAVEKVARMRDLAGLQNRDIELLLSLSFC